MDFWEIQPQARQRLYRPVGRKGRANDDEEELIAHSLDRLFDLQKYPFTALEIAPSVDEEQAADIFVRINSEGVKLNQADFILTLLSVFWDEGRAALERFVAPRGKPLRPDLPLAIQSLYPAGPDQLLRVSIAWDSAAPPEERLPSAAWQGHRDRGVSPSSGRSNSQSCKRAQAHANLRDWHQFLTALIGAGFVAGR